MAGGFTGPNPPPRIVEAVIADRTVALPFASEDCWSGDGMEVTLRKCQAMASIVTSKAPRNGVRTVHLRWPARFESKPGNL